MAGVQSGTNAGGGAAARDGGCNCAVQYDANDEFPGAPLLDFISQWLSDLVASG